jgi:hypothetical protein
MPLFPGMKSILFATAFFLLIFPACRKNNVETSEILGSWKLIQVYDKTMATAIYPPAGSNMDVVITFLTRNSFAGHTLRNALIDGVFEQNGDEIIFKNFSMTEVAEDEWGGSFLTVLHACSLQSVSPCVPSAITIQGDLMNIRTPLRYDIMLRKI